MVISVKEIDFVCISFCRDRKIIYLEIKNIIVKVIYFLSKEVYIYKYVLLIKFLISLDKIIGTTALTKYYCQYRKDISLLRMINFTQTSTKQVKSI